MDDEVDQSSNESRNLHEIPEDHHDDECNDDSYDEDCSEDDYYGEFCDDDAELNDEHESRDAGWDSSYCTGWDSSEVSCCSTEKEKEKRIFQQSYLCYPFSHIQRSNLEGGNRVIMPQSALDRLASLEIEYPMIFEIKSHFYEELEPIWHCGVLEFTADEGFVFVPNWMMKNLQLEPGELVKLKSVELPKGNYMKLQPHKTEFMSLKDPKEVLEVALKNFACLTAGETIMISYDGKEYFFDVLETEPKNGISVVETDCVVDFAAPLDYEFEQEKGRKAIAPLANEVKEKEIASEEVIKFKAFSGVGRRLDGKEQSKLRCDESKVETERKCCGKLMVGNEGSCNGDGVNDKVSEGEGEKRVSDGRVKGTNFQPFQGKKHLLTS